MTDGRQWQPAGDKAPHAVPVDAAVLAAPRQRAMPEPSNSEPKQLQRRLIHRHPVVSGVSTYHRLQPFALFWDGFVHAPPKLGFHRVQLRLQALADRLPQHGKPSITPLLYADVRKAQEVERLRFPFPPTSQQRRVISTDESCTPSAEKEVSLCHSPHQL
jgi:hypothetical protein